MRLRVSEEREWIVLDDGPDEGPIMAAFSIEGDTIHMSWTTKFSAPGSGVPVPLAVDLCESVSVAVEAAVQAGLVRNGYSEE